MSVKRRGELYRIPSQGKIAGVCAGLSRLLWLGNLVNQNTDCFWCIVWYALAIVSIHCRLVHSG